MTNHLLLIGIAYELVLLLLLIYTPPLQSVFETAPLDSYHWALLMCFPPVLLMLEEMRKAGRTRFCS